MQLGSAQRSATLCGASQMGPASRNSSSSRKSSELRLPAPDLFDVQQWLEQLNLVHFLLSEWSARSVPGGHSNCCCAPGIAPLFAATKRGCTFHWCRFVSAAQGNGVGCDAVQTQWVASTVRIPFAQPAAAQQVSSCCRLVSRGPSFESLLIGWSLFCVLGAVLQLPSVLLSDASMHSHFLCRC